MKVLGIMGSPISKGNTHAMVASILEGARQYGADVEILLLGELKIRECDGCHSCWRTGKCSKNDDMAQIYEKIAQSDAFVFGTPVYWYGPTALIKAFLDRLVYFNCPETREQIKNKLAVLAIPFEEEDPAAAELIVAMFQRSFAYLQMPPADVLLAPGLKAKGDVINRPEVINRAVEIGKKLSGN